MKKIKSIIFLKVVVFFIIFTSVGCSKLASLTNFSGKNFGDIQLLFLQAR